MKFSDSCFVITFICFSCFRCEERYCKDVGKYKKFVKDMTKKKRCSKCNSESFLFRDGFYNEIDSDQ